MKLLWRIKKSLLGRAGRQQRKRNKMTSIVFASSVSVGFKMMKRQKQSAAECVSLTKPQPHPIPSQSQPIGSVVARGSIV